MPKGVSYPKGQEYKGKTIHHKAKRPSHTGGGDTWGTPAGGGTKRSHEHPSPSDFSHSLPTNPFPHGPAKMKGAKMNPTDQDTMSKKKTKGVR